MDVKHTDNPIIHLEAMFGYICNVNGGIRVANRIFETRLYNYFLSEEELTNAMYDKAQGNKGMYFQNGMVLEGRMRNWNREAEVNGIER